MTDIVERLRRHGHSPWMFEAADETERLRELLRGTGANRYWEGRWRDAQAEIEQMRAENARLQGVIQFMDAAKLAS